MTPSMSLKFSSKYQIVETHGCIWQELCCIWQQLRCIWQQLCCILVRTLLHWVNFIDLEGLMKLAASETCWSLILTKMINFVFKFYNLNAAIVQYYFLSSLHWSISLSFCSFLYNGVYYDVLKLSLSDVIVVQKGSNGDRKIQFFGWDYN